MAFKCDCGGRFMCIDSRSRGDYTYRRYRCRGCAEYLTSAEVVVRYGKEGRADIAELMQRIFATEVELEPADERPFGI